MTNYRQQLEELNNNLLKAITQLISKSDTFIFLTDEEIENGECEDYFEVRNDITGSVFDVHLVSVSSEGIKVVEADDTTRFHTIRVNDFVMIDDKINLYEMLLEKSENYNHSMEQFTVLSDEQIENLTINAIELGIDYWAWFKNKKDVTNTDTDKSFSERVLATVLNGGKVRIYDTETEEFLGYFSKENIKKGTELMYKNQPSHFADIINETDDSITADVWFQYVVMGELVYG